jgi:hypothetical protein
LTFVDPNTATLDAEELLVGTALGPGIWIAPYPTQGPNDIHEAWGPSWSSLGYASEDGPTVASSTGSTDMRAWQSIGVLRSVITDRTVTVHFNLLQWNAQNLGLYWDIESPTVAADGTFKFDVRSDQGAQRHTIGVDVKDGPNQVRMIFPRVQLNATGDMQFQRGALAMLDMTFAALETDGVLLQVIGSIPAAAGESVSPPGITHIDPTSGAAGDVITIWGVGFTSATGVLFGTTPADWATATIDSDNDIRLTVPPNPGGPGPVQVTVQRPPDENGIGDLVYSSPPGWTYTALSGQAAGAQAAPPRGPRPRGGSD